MLKAIWECINRRQAAGGALWAQAPETNDDEEDDQLAHEILTSMQTAEKTGEDLRTRVANVVSSSSWTESLAQAVLKAVDEAIKTGLAVQNDGPLKEAIHKAVKEAAGFAKDHPVWTTVIALGVLVELLPWVIEALGFAEMGPVAGTFASWWQVRYAGYVPKGSLFSYFQRLGMVWKHRRMVKSRQEPIYLEARMEMVA